MSPLATSAIVFLSVLAGTGLGLLLRERLPDHHLSKDSKDVIGLGIGMVATMAALILGLMTASAQSSFDAQSEAIGHVATDLLALDRTLASYGPETAHIREMLKAATQQRLKLSWPEEFGIDGLGSAVPALPEQGKGGAKAVAETIDQAIVTLEPASPVQTWYKSRALELTADLLATRWTVFSTSADSSIPLPFLVVVVFWLAVIFGSFGLFAPRNATVGIVLLICALSVAASVFLILEMSRPFDGMMKVSSAPLRYTLSELGR